MEISRRKLLLSLAAMSVVPASTRIFADSATVNAVGVKFEPPFVYIEQGQAVSWVNMAGHNVELIEAMMPEGAEYFISTLGDDINHTFDVPGVYIYKCTPHWGARMGGGIVVGSPDDPKSILDGYMAMVEKERGNLLPAKGLIKKFIKDLDKNL